MKEEKKFQTESKELLNLMINSIYSNKEVFLRELISNASDAIDKYKLMMLQSEGKYQPKDYKIQLVRNKDERYLEVIDNGIGMEKENLEKNLGTIARSGTKEFLEKCKEQKEKNEDVDLIGQFGVGFYSAFMVAKKIEVYTHSLTDHYYVFSSDGVETYTIEEVEKIDSLPTSGSAVRVYLKDDTEDEKYSEYLEDYELRNLVKKYSDFIRYPIEMEVTKVMPDLDENGKAIEGKTHEEKSVETLNSMIPLWKKNKKDVTEEEMDNFYKTRFNDYENPLLSINIHAEGTFDYDSIVYIPSHVPYDLYSQDYEKGLALYAKGIFITEKNKELIPDYLKFVKGVVDSEDLSLNISREMLQKSPLLEKIQKNIEKKVIERLKQLKNEDNDKYQKFFENYGSFIKYGIYTSYGAKKDLLSDLLIYSSIEQDKKISLKEYKDSMKEGQKYIYYATGKTIDSIKLLPEIGKYHRLGYDVLLMNENIDEFTLMMMHDYAGVEFKNITSQDKDDISEEDKKKITDLETDNRRFLDDMKASLKDKVDEVTFSLNLGDAPVSLTTKQGLSMNMEKVLNSDPARQGSEEEKVKAEKVMEINPDHPLFEAVKAITDENEIKKLSSVFYDEAMILEGFEIEDKSDFVKNLNELMLKAYQNK